MPKKLNFLLFALLFSNLLNSQTLKGILADRVTKKPLDLATIFIKESGYTVFSDSEGKFSIDIGDNKKGEIVISSIGYEDLEVNLIDYLNSKTNSGTFFLVPKTEKLEEVVISNEKIDYSWAKTISSKRKPVMGFSFQFGTENVRLIQNPYFKKGKIKKVILSLSKMTKNREQPKWEIDYITAYSVKFYEYDVKNQKPGKELYDKNIIVEPGNKSQNLEIDVDSLNIPFPKNGVCVGVEYLNTKYVNPKKVFAIIAPGMNFYEEENLKPIMSWVRYRGEDWEFKSSISSFKNRRYQNVLVVDMVVNTEN